MRRKTACSKFRSQGFTLIELVVAFSIMAILSTVGVASFVNYSRSQTIQQAANNLSTALNTAKAAAVAQTVSLSINGVSLACPAGRSFGGYGITIYPAVYPAANNYTYYIMCAGGKVYPPSSVFTPLPSKVIFGPYPSISTTNDVFFAVLTGGVSGAGNIVLDGSLLGLPAGSSLRTINIDSGANILIPTP
jgi:prepilin-type N-terminal cleavage/methylation domain-containing protein